MARKLDAWCDVCGEVRPHEVVDPGSCKCVVCGRVEVMVVPLED